MMMLSDYIVDFCASEQFGFLDAGLKPHAESMLAHWCSMITGDLTIAKLQTSLSQTAALNVPVDARKTFPDLLEAFFAWLASSGNHPPAAGWVDLVSLVRTDYTARIRDDGTVKGETFKKNYTDVGRNDVCPCGSGKKFKKCCMGLIS